MDSLKVTFTLRGQSAFSFKKACEISGLKPCDFAKSASVSEMRKWMKLGNFENTQVSSAGDFLAHTRDDKDLSLDKSNSSPSDIKEFFKTFIGKIEIKLFPERVSKEIKNQWEAIIESQLTATELADLYNKYTKQQKQKDSIPSHPNSWIAGHGWLNNEEETNDEPTGNYDF